MAGCGQGDANGESGKAGFARGCADRITRFIDAVPIGDEEKTRLRHYTIFLFLGVPTMLAFGVYDLVATSNPLLCALIFSSGAGLLAGWFALVRWNLGRNVYRANAALFSLLLLYMLVFGGEDGSKILWIYTFPLIALFLLGRREGIFWTAGIGAVSLGLFLAPPGGWNMYPYDVQFKVRFLASFFIVSLVALGFEHLREKYHSELTVEKERIEEEKKKLVVEIEERIRVEREKERLIRELTGALGKVRRLSGLLPICASCKNVRDDKGYWSEIETYLRDHSEAEFSHGICPSCAKKLYPGFLDKE